MHKEHLFIRYIACKSTVQEKGKEHGITLGKLANYIRKSIKLTAPWYRGSVGPTSSTSCVLQPLSPPLTCPVPQGSNWKIIKFSIHIFLVWNYNKISHPRHYNLINSYLMIFWASYYILILVSNLYWISTLFFISIIIFPVCLCIILVMWS